jgi:ABC-type transporter Mla MlaB component
MLRITDTLHTSADGRACWVLHLHGTLGGEWVRELRRVWRRTRTAAADAAIRVELADVSFVDAAGKLLLMEMYRDGVDIAANGCLTSAIRDDIVAGCAADRRR